MPSSTIWPNHGGRLAGWFTRADYHEVCALFMLDGALPLLFSIPRAILSLIHHLRDSFGCSRVTCWSLLVNFFSFSHFTCWDYLLCVIDFFLADPTAVSCWRFDLGDLFFGRSRFTSRLSDAAALLYLSIRETCAMLGLLDFSFWLISLLSDSL